MVILGVDYGRKRIGLAVGDSASGFVFPLRTIELKKRQNPVAAVLEAAEAEHAGHIVVGMPRRLDGKTERPGEMEQEVSTFVGELTAKTALTIDVEDERLSTALAKRLCQAAEGKGATDKDAVSACVILESYILRTFRRDDAEWLKDD